MLITSGLQYLLLQYEEIFVTSSFDLRLLPFRPHLGLDLIMHLLQRGDRLLKPWVAVAPSNQPRMQADLLDDSVVN